MEKGEEIGDLRTSSVTLHKIRRLLEDRAGMLHLIGRPGARIVLN